MRVEQKVRSSRETKGCLCQEKMDRTFTHDFQFGKRSKLQNENCPLNY